MTNSRDRDLEIVSRFRSRLIEDLLGKGARPLAEYLEEVPQEHWALAARAWIEMTGEGALPERVEEDAEDLVADDFGPYRLIRELGRGGQGNVHLAEDLRRLMHHLRRRIKGAHKEARNAPSFGPRGMQGRVLVADGTRRALDARHHCSTLYDMGATITLRATAALHSALRRRAQAEGVTLSELVRRLLEEALEERPLEARIAHLRGRLQLPPESGASWREELRRRNWRG